MLYFPPFLGGILLNQGIAKNGIVPFVVFSLISSAGYIFNDLMDRKTDLNHPRKSTRPIASGRVPVKTAQILAGILTASAIALAISINKMFVMIVFAYLAVSIAYSCCLKNIPVVDLFCIATGFLFRLMAGGEAFDVRVSEWLFLSVLLLALFLSAGKRLSEKQLLANTADDHRKVLAHYPVGFLDGVLFMTGSAVLVTYTMYTLSHRTLLYTVPLCCFGLLRYILRVKAGLSGDPTESLLRDPWLLVVGAGWSVMVGLGIYGS
jgi:4-hydroxybenzoate polyprenyltransferase